MGPLTEGALKCLLPLRGKPLLEYQLEAFRACGVDDLVLVGGYRSEDLLRYGLPVRINERYETTNMVHSLFCAKRDFTEDVIVSYGDIIFEQRILRSLLGAGPGFSVIVDRGWLSLWKERREDPLEDAETLRLEAGENIVEIGGKPGSIEEIEGQYIGLFRIRGEAVARVRDFYLSLDRDSLYCGRSFDGMFMTDLIQLVARRLMKVRAVPVRHGWLEVDSPEDLRRYEGFGPDQARLFRF